MLVEFVDWEGEQIFLLSVFGLANLSLAISSFVPFKTQFMGVSNESDGRKLMRIPFLREDELAQSPLDEEWLVRNRHLITIPLQSLPPFATAGQHF